MATNHPTLRSIFGDSSQVHATANDAPSSHFHPSQPAIGLASDTGATSQSIDDEPWEYDQDDLRWDNAGQSDDEYEYSGSSPERDTTHTRSRATRTHWLSYTKEERAVAQQVGEADSRNLTFHLLNVHGIGAQKYGAAPSDARPVPGSVTYRREWASGWIPRRSWTSWPLRPEDVPRTQQRVWSDSIHKPESWTPSSELEECLHAYLLRTARRQWNSRESAPPEPPPAPPAPPRVPKRRGRAVKLSLIPPETKKWWSDFEASVKTLTNQNQNTEPEAFVANLTNQHQTTQNTSADTGESSRKSQEDNGQEELGEDAPVFSLDDEKSRELLQPMIRSTISSLDRVLAAVVKSRKGSTFSRRPTLKRSYSEYATEDSDDSPDEAKPTRIHKPPKPVEQDWSQILGFASISGISPAAVSRAAARCAVLFNENMAFAKLREEDNSKPPPPAVFEPSTIQGRGELTEPSPAVWSSVNGCPYPDCPWFGRRFPVEEKLTKRIDEHMRRSHHWDLTVAENMQEEVTGMSGGVHVDGYLKPIVPRWRGRDRVSTKKKNHPDSTSQITIAKSLARDPDVSSEEEGASHTSGKPDVTMLDQDIASSEEDEEEEEQNDDEL